MTRTAAFAVALLVLAACDSGTSGADDDLIGSWTFASASNQSVGVVSQAQDMVDLTRATEGSVTLSGAESGSLRYVHSYYSYDSQSSLSLTSYDPNANEYPSSWQTLSINQGPNHSSAALTASSNDGTTYYYNEAVGAGVSRNSARFTVNVDMASYYDNTTPARAEGTITLGHRTLAAGERSTFSEYAYEFPPNNTARYAFEREGVLRTQQVSGNQTVERTGSWKRVGDRVVLSTTEDGITTSFEYRVQQDGAALLLIDDRSASACDAECRRYAEQQFGIVAGTLTSFQTELTLRLVPTASGARAQVAPAAAVPLPEPLQARVSIRPRARR